MKKFFLHFMHEEEGATMIEYAIMASLIAAVCVAIIIMIGTKVLALFTNVNGAPW